MVIYEPASQSIISEPSAPPPFFWLPQSVYQKEIRFLLLSFSYVLKSYFRSSNYPTRHTQYPLCGWNASHSVAMLFLLGFRL